MNRKNDTAYKIAMTGLMAALSYVVFTFGQIRLTLPGGDATSIHLGNAVCVLGALLIGGFYGGLGGAIGLITGFVAHRIGKITASTDRRHILKYVILASAAGLIFNVIADPLFGYYYKLLIIGKPAAELALVWNVASTSINAVVSAVASVFIYMAARPVLRTSGLLLRLS